MVDGNDRAEARRNGHPRSARGTYHDVGGVDWGDVGTSGQGAGRHRCSWRSPASVRSSLLDPRDPPPLLKHGGPISASGRCPIGVASRARPKASDGSRPAAPDALRDDRGPRYPRLLCASDLRDLIQRPQSRHRRGCSGLVEAAGIEPALHCPAPFRPTSQRPMGRVFQRMSLPRRPAPCRRNPSCTVAGWWHGNVSFPRGSRGASGPDLAPSKGDMWRVPSAARRGLPSVLP
jgi:hypothetical protein